jgi:hypothetical protein
LHGHCFDPSTQAKERQDGHDDDDETDQINNTIHDQTSRLLASLQASFTAKVPLRSTAASAVPGVPLLIADVPRVAGTRAEIVKNRQKVVRGTPQRSRPFAAIARSVAERPRQLFIKVISRSSAATVHVG